MQRVRKYPWPAARSFFLDLLADGTSGLVVKDEFVHVLNARGVKLCHLVIDTPMFLTLPAPVGAYRTVKAATYFDDPGARTLRTELYSQRYAQKTRPIVGNLQSFPMSCELFTYHCPMNSRDRRLTIAERLKVNREASIAELAFAFGTRR